MNNGSKAFAGATIPRVELSRLFGVESCRELVDRIVADLIAGRGVITIEGVRGGGKTTLMNAIALALREHPFFVIRATASTTPLHIQQLIGSASCIAADSLEPKELFWAVQSKESARDIVLFFDDADTLPDVTFSYVLLLLKLFKFGKIKINIVFIGSSGEWVGLKHPELEELRERTGSRITIGSLKGNEAKPILSRKRRGWWRPSSQQIMVSPPQQSLVGQASVSSPSGYQLMKLPALSRRIPWQLPFMVALALIVWFEARDPITNPATIAQANLANLLQAGDESSAKEHPPTAPPALAAASELPQIPTISPANVPVDDLAAAAGPILEPSDPASSSARLADLPVFGPTRRGAPGLALLAQTGDTMPALYAKVYRGLSPPPYAEVVAVNREPFKPGSIVVFPAPPEGWTKR